jgi:hypothetical protein
MLGRDEGLSVGDTVGRRVGRKEGFSVLNWAGAVGERVGLLLDSAEGAIVGSIEGSIVGSKDGSTVGCTEGKEVLGRSLGATVGESVEGSVGGEVGGEVGAFNAAIELGARGAKVARKLERAVGMPARPGSPERGADE